MSTGSRMSNGWPADQAQPGPRWSRRTAFATFRQGSSLKIVNLSFGSTAAIVTSMALIFGLDAATATKSTIVSGLLIVALADNLTDALSMHVYEESHGRLLPREAFFATFSNFVAAQFPQDGCDHGLACSSWERLGQRAAG